MELVYPKFQLPLKGKKQFGISELVSDRETGVSYDTETMGCFPELSVLNLVLVMIAQVLP